MDLAWRLWREDWEQRCRQGEGGKLGLEALKGGQPCVVQR